MGPHATYPIYVATDAIPLVGWSAARLEPLEAAVCLSKIEGREEMACRIFLPD